MGWFEIDIAGFILFAAAMIATPGPANMVLLAAGARYGLRPALPFVAGIVVGKQLIIWPIGFGLMTLAREIPAVFEILRWASAAYVLWLAWRIAGASIAPGSADAAVPGFAAGLIVHPLNPKAWAMITAGFTNFVAAGASEFGATLGIAAVLFTVQCVLHPIWCWGGAQIAHLVSGKPAERWVMRTLAGLTVLSVVYVLAKEGL